MPPDSASLAEEIRRRLGPPPELPQWPPVSIVVPSRDGAEHLRRLLEGLREHTDYPRLELVVVDNASRDDSLDFLRRVEAPFPISILANPHNESFSDACNQGAELASGELLLFCNNDVEPFEPGWLGELVACLEGLGAGAAAATLICLDEEHEASFRYGYGVQHRGLAFREEEGTIQPVLHGWEADPLDERLGEDEERGAVAAACLLIARDAFEEVGGFSRGYAYGVEDVDLCLKLRASGRRILCSGRSLAIHHPVSTRRTLPFEEERARKLANRRLLLERWGPRLRREYELDRLEGRGLWAEAPTASTPADAEPPPTRAEVEALGFCLFSEEDDPGAARSAEALAAELRRRGRRCLALVGEDLRDPRPLAYDVAVYIKRASRFVPRPAQLNVLWSLGDEPAAIERSRYALAIAEPPPLERHAESLLAAVEARAREVGYRGRISPEATGDA